MATLAYRLLPRGTTTVRTVPTGWLAGFVLLWLGLDTVLLWRFIGFCGPVVQAGGVVAAGGLAWGAARAVKGPGPDVATLGGALVLAFALMLLGGEGRVFYANPDWQVRDAVLRDLGLHPWPFVYDGAAGAQLLRAPLGMYLIPALVGKAGGQAAADVALLVQNTLLLGAMLAVAATLFARGRARIVAGVVFVGFSGMDILGTLLVRGAGGLGWTTHLESYAGLQFSSTVTLAFWVPPHALAGWLAALAVLLWRAGRLRAGAVAALVPTICLWSPLAAIGLVPFAALAGVTALRRGELRTVDVAMPVAATAFAVPVLGYLAAAPDVVGAHVAAIEPARWLVFEAIDALPLLALGAMAARARFGGALLGLSAAMLLALPWFEVGWSNDLEMRASIVPLALLAAHLADIMAGVRSDAQVTPRHRAMLVAVLAIGAATPATEIARALTSPTSPVPRCGFSRAWDESFGAFPKGSYLAPLDRVPGWIKPTAPAHVRNTDPASCYDRPWPMRL